MPFDLQFRRESNHPFIGLLEMEGKGAGSTGSGLWLSTGDSSTCVGKNLGCRSVERGIPS
jgi:hypothetical protein